MKRAILIGLALLVAGSGWAVRTIGVNHVLRAQAFAFHNDWAWIPEDMERRVVDTGSGSPLPDGEHAIRVELKDSEGRVVQWFGTNTDVDALRQAERMACRVRPVLAASSSRLRRGGGGWSS